MNVKGAISLFLFLFLLIVINVPAQEGMVYRVPGGAKIVAGLWLLFLVVGFLLIVVSMFLHWTILFNIGILLLLLSVVSAVGSVVLPLFMEKTVTYEECKELFKPGVGILTVPGLMYATSCILTGYVPTKMGWLPVITFLIFGIALPIWALSAVFWDAIPEELITSPYARKTIAISGTLLAFRGFYATYFIEVLSYGFAGMGALLISILFIGFLWKRLIVFVTPIGKVVEAEIKIAQKAEAEEILRQIRDLRKAMAQAAKEGKEGEVEKCRKEIERLRKLLKEMK